MPHVVFLPLTGFRVKEDEMLRLGMSLPGFRQRSQAVAELPALGLLTLAGTMPPDWTCSYLPAKSASDDVIQEVATRQPDLVALSALTASIAEAYELSRRLRTEGIPVVIGGLHATALPDEAARHCDAVVTGHGESVWRDVLADATSGTLRPIYRAASGATNNDWPVPRFDLVGASPPRFTLQTQRGCPLACEFCGASRLLGRFREKPTASIRRELGAIRAIDARPLIELADDNTFAGTRDVPSFLDAMAESNARWFTEADWRIAENPALLQRLAGSGCVQVLMGIESLVFRYPGLGGKQAELNRMLEAVHAVQEAGVAVNACFIVGADGETRESMDRLVQFLLAGSFAEVQITLQTPFPGTALYERLRRAGRLLPNRDWGHYTLFDVTYQPDGMSVVDLETGFRDVVQQVFSEDSTRRRNSIRIDVWHRNPRLRS